MRRLSLFVLCLSVLPLFSSDNTWQGINYSATGSSVSNVDDAASWSLGRIPGVGNEDRAIFLFQSYIEGAVQKDLYIWPTNQFNPSAIYFDGNNGSQDWTQERDLYIEKSLVLTNFTIITDTTSSGRQANRIRLNNTGSGAVLTMAGDTAVFDVSEAYWSALNLKNDIIFTATNIYFPGGSKSGDAITGATGAESLVFTNPVSTIYLGARAGAAMNLGVVGLYCVPGQTWNCDTNAYIQMELNGTRDIIQTSDEVVRLDGMGEVHFSIKHAAYGDHSFLDLIGGTYGSLVATGGGARQFKITAGGDINLMGVYPQREFGLLLFSSHTGLNACQFDLNGYDLNVMGGGLKFSTGVKLYAYGSKVYVNGDIVLVTGGTANGIYADADTEIWFTGSYSNDYKCTIANCLYQSTVNAVGGGQVQYYEVGDKSALTVPVESSLSVGTFNVGVDSTNATVVLVNNFQNNNPTVVTNEAIDKIGEKLVVNTLNIASNSVLDLNGQILNIGAELYIAETGCLDLNTGIELYNGYVVTNFLSIGGNYEEWEDMQDRIKDSSNPEFSFRPKEEYDVHTPYGADSYLDFDGVDDYVDLSSGDGLDISSSRTPFTVELWMKGDVSADSWGYAIHRGSDQNAGSSVYWLGVNGRSGTYGAAVSGNIGSTQTDLYDTGVTVDPDAWHHLALTYDGTNQYVYLDGTLKAGGNVGAIGNSLSNNKIGIGSTPNDPDLRPIDGIIGEVRVWNYVRTGAEIADNMNRQMTGSEAGLVGYWPLDDSSGTIAADLAGDNDGTLVNGASWSAPLLLWEACDGPKEGTLLIVK